MVLAKKLLSTLTYLLEAHSQTCLLVRGKPFYRKSLKTPLTRASMMSFPKKKKKISLAPSQKRRNTQPNLFFFSNPSNNFVATPRQEKKVLIAKSQLLQSQHLAIDPKPSIPQNPLREEEIPPLESSDLSDTDGLDFQFHKKPSSEYNSNPHRRDLL
jgi:hypothetical protein